MTKDDAREVHQFLNWLRPQGPWPLTAIVVEKDGKGRATFTNSFHASEFAGVIGWLTAQRDKNLYYMVNRPSRLIFEKATKGDVEAVEFLHVDVDPAESADLAQEQAKILERLSAFDPKPSGLIFSGGGYQALWRLNAALAVANDKSKIELVEECNRGLEEALGGDNCHNVDRVLRLPGTQNQPDQKKRAKGRLSAKAQIVWLNDLVYELSHFPRAPKDQKRAQREDKKTTLPKLDIATAIGVNALDLSAIDPDRARRLRQLIYEGLTNPEFHSHYKGDRSRAVYGAMCELIRADVSDQHIVGVLINPDNRLSEHVLEGKPDPESCARRSLANALRDVPRPGPIVNDSPRELARAFVDHVRPTIQRYMDDFYVFVAGGYSLVGEDTVRAEVYRFLEACRVRDDDGSNSLDFLVPTPHIVNSVIDALQSLVLIPSEDRQAPFWIKTTDGQLDAINLVALRNGVVDLATGTLYPSDPNLFTTNALRFDYDAQAPKPARWLNFLEQVWPASPSPHDDQEDCRRALQEFAGYILTADTRLHKALLMYGPMRSGKGTIASVLIDLVGKNNVVSPSLSSFGRGDFPLEPLLGKKLALVPELKLGPKTDAFSIVENLLSITGEDTKSVNRKNRSAVEAKLDVRFVVLSNSLPRLPDSTGALQHRFIILPMRVSFLGREDTGLKAALREELPGIFNWAIEGWRRMQERGALLQPASGKVAVLEMMHLASRVKSFVEERCVLGSDARIEKAKLFSAFLDWHHNTFNDRYRSGDAIFAQDLYDLSLGVRALRVRDVPGYDKLKTPWFTGIALKTSPEPPF